MNQRIARCAAFLWVTLMLAACQTTVPAASPTVSPTRVIITRWPTRTPTATHTPLPTLTPTATRTPSPTPLPDLTLVQLRNLTYPNEWANGGVAEMVDSVFREPAVGESEELVITVADMVTFGDLDGDRRDDGAVLLVVHPAGGGSHFYLNIVLSRGGEATPVAPLALGDRMVPRSMAVATGRLTLEMLTYAAGDAPCCPSLDSRRIYELEDDALSLVRQWDGPRQQSAAPPVLERQTLPFAPGTTATLVRGSLYPLGDQRYVLHGQTGQSLEMGVTSPYERVFISLRGLEDGTVLTSVVSETTRWSGELPSTQDYQITLVSIAGSATSYVLAAAVDPAPVPELPAVTATLTPTLAAGPAPTATQTLALTVTVGPTETVSVSPLVRSVVPAGSVLYLTFDGASEDSGWAGPVADVLLTFGVRGTFFLPVPDGPVGAALVQSGHTVGILGNTDQTLDVIGRQALAQTPPLAQAVPGTVGTRCIRPSYGAMDAHTRAWMAEVGYKVVLWDTSSATPMSSTATEVEAVVAELLSQVHPGAVLRFRVLSDGAQMVVLLEQVLPLLEAQGYGFRSVCLGPDVE
jgi:peptidoglycan/xylan/chitin deacetylase (PgdA/CDA1 family)